MKGRITYTQPAKPANWLFLLEANRQLREAEKTLDRAAELLRQAAQRGRNG